MKKSIILGLLVLSLFCYITVTNCDLASSTHLGIHHNLASNVELIIDYGNSTQQVFQSLSGATVFDLLNETSTVAFAQYPFGIFVTSINGVENNANNNGHYWQYWVNGELAPISADNYVLSDGDQVLWKYCAPEETQTPPTSTSPELLMALGIIGAVGTIVVIAALIVYLKIR